MNTVAKVASASSGELLCITYELLLEHIEKALLCTGDERRKSLFHAREVLAVLTENLNFEISLSKDLFQTYLYVQKLLVAYRQEDKQIQEAHQLITQIYKAYSEVVEKEQIKTPLMQNAQEIYAGVTYGKGYLNEMLVEEENRGFRA
jgi:flagellar protein FliS